MHKPKLAVVCLALMLCSRIGLTAPGIAVLDFELNDITSLPNTIQERQRTASFRPLLEAALSQAGDYRIVTVDTAEQADANPGFGYLFRFGDLAADLGAQAGADWVVVGQHSKPSFLYSYLMVHLVNVKNRAQVANFDIELKGNHHKVSQHAARAMADKIHRFLQANPLP
ncbi:MAG: DUF3280 domain-containing protein [Methylococcales bacterium]|nr:DUF3280 domain-containing protein [Methylococcales bacterium]